MKEENLGKGFIKKGAYILYIYLETIGFSFLLQRIVLKEDNLGKGFIKKGALILYIYLDTVLVLPFCYKNSIERGEPWNRGLLQGGHIFYTFIWIQSWFSSFVTRIVLKKENLGTDVLQRGWGKGGVCYMGRGGAKPPYLQK